MPTGGSPFPLILVVQELFVVHEHIKDICRRLAKEGYMAVAAELYARQGDVSRMTNIQEIVVSVVSKVADAQVVSDLDAVVAYAKTSGDVERLGITGFCWGGADYLALCGAQHPAQGGRCLVRAPRRRG
jgi:carboxymethylenebutenolidase